MNPKITKTKKRELPAISKIYKAEFSKPPYNEKWTPGKIKSKMKFFYKFYEMYTIKYDKEIIGFVVINPNFMCPGDVAFGEEIAIKSDYQNKGIGTKVIKTMFEIYRKRGFKKFIGIAASNSKPLKLYKKIGLIPSKSDVLVEKN